jgi:hypothetical protein
MNFSSIVNNVLRESYSVYPDNTTRRVTGNKVMAYEVTRKIFNHIEFTGSSIRHAVDNMLPGVLYLRNTGNAAAEKNPVTKKMTYILQTSVMALCVYYNTFRPNQVQKLTWEPVGTLNPGIEYFKLLDQAKVLDLEDDEVVEHYLLRYQKKELPPALEALLTRDGGDCIDKALKEMHHNEVQRIKKSHEPSGLSDLIDL